MPPPADKVLDGHRADDDQVADSSHDGRHAQNSDVRHGNDRPPTVQRSMTIDRYLRTVHFNHPDQRKLHSRQRYCLSAFAVNISTARGQKTTCNPLTNSARHVCRTEKARHTDSSQVIMNSLSAGVELAVRVT